MTTTWGTLTIGAAPIQISTSYLPCCKISFQVAPGATGPMKIGGAGLTAATSTPGTFLDSTAATDPDGSAQAGDSWSVQRHTQHAGRFRVPCTRYACRGQGVFRVLPELTQGPGAV